MPGNSIYCVCAVVHEETQELGFHFRNVAATTWFTCTLRGFFSPMKKREIHVWWWRRMKLKAIFFFRGGNGCQSFLSKKKNLWKIQFSKQWEYLHHFYIGKLMLRVHVAAAAAARVPFVPRVPSTDLGATLAAACVLSQYYRVTTVRLELWSHWRTTTSSG